MAVTITAGDLAVVLRAAPAADEVDARILTVVNLALSFASSCVMDYAPKAPDGVHNAAVARLAGWLYDADPSDPQTANALRVSGAQSMLAMYREHRAGVFGEASEGPGPAPQPVPSGIPAPPDDGNYILTANDGDLAWVAFPEP